MSDYGSGTLSTAIVNFVRQCRMKQYEDEEIQEYNEHKDETPDYKEYINSPEWKETSRRAKERAGYRCQLCNRKGDDTTLHTHHRTYVRLGIEFDEDLIVLCNSCHKKHHGIELYKDEDDNVQFGEITF